MKILKLTGIIVSVTAVVLTANYFINSSAQVDIQVNNSLATATSTSPHLPTPPSSISRHNSSVSPSPVTAKTEFNKQPITVKFEVWINSLSKDDGSQRVRLIAEGIELAKQRRAMLLKQMQNQPRQALANRLSYAQYYDLPDEVKSLVEEPFSSRADLVVVPKEQGDSGGVKDTGTGSDNASSHDIYIETWDNGKKVYTLIPLDSTDNLLSKQGVAVQGIRLNGVAVIFQDSLEIVQSKEQLQRLKVIFKSTNKLTKQNISRDYYTGEVIKGEPVIALAGGHLFPFANEYNVALLNAQLERSKQSINPKAGSELFPSFDSSKNTEGTETLQQRMLVSSRTAAINPWTETVKKVFFIRVDFTDIPGEPVTRDILLNRLNNEVSDAIREFSYGKTWIEADVNAPLVSLPNSSSSYVSSGVGVLHADAVSGFNALNTGTNLDDYDIIGVYFPDIDAFAWAGKASLGGTKQWLNQSHSTRIITHELGHNYGLNHANFWDTSDASVVGTGINEEYGHRFDTMGLQSPPEAHFHVQGKERLHWLNGSQWQDITSSGLHRIYRFDDQNTSAANLQSIRISKGSNEYYWLGFRKKYTTNPYLSSGLSLIWQRPNANNSWLVDTTPGSADGKLDAGIRLGRTYSDTTSDTTANVHITPTRQGGTAPHEWIDVQINLGEFVGNQAPSASISATSTGDARIPIVFTAVANDPDGDPLAYLWDFGDGVIENSSVSVAHSWTQGGSYTVTLTVSDMKGQVATTTHDITIADPLTQWSDRASGVTSTLNDLAEYNGTLLAVGRSLSSSTDGSSWTAVSNAFGSNVNIRGITHYGNLWVAVGERYSFDVSAWLGVIYTSPDATSWTQQRFEGAVLDKVASSGATLVVVGENGTILRSTDGLAWQSVTGVTTRDIDDIAYSGTTFVFVGQASNGSDGFTFSSTDGTNWTEQSDAIGLLSWQGVNEIEYTHDRFLVSGWYAKVRHSTDQGASFSTTRTKTEEIAGFAYGNGIYFAAGLNKDDNGSVDIDMVSLDGETWERMPSPSVDNRREAIFFNNTFITVGSNGSIRQSDPILVVDSNTDVDTDGVLDTVDNCPATANADQLDTDTDGQGDVCDGDDDNDNVVDTADNCPITVNQDQANNDNDSQGDVCDTDDDNDTVADTTDNCPLAANTNQANHDNDADGDVCDSDDDNDGMPDSYEGANGLDSLNAADAGQDNDSDGYTNLQEFQLATNPTDATSFPNISSAFIAKGANWKYLDNGTDQATAWQAISFDDTSWQSGPARLGYGNGGESTVVSFGGNSSSKYITTYFRYEFDVLDPAQYESLVLELARDDGAVVYLNGTEILRDNMTSGTITYQTRASSAANGTEETQFTPHTVSTTALVAGKNTLAVEIHQASSSSSDLNFDLALAGVTPNLITKGARWNYLDNGSDQATVWHANSFDDSSWSSGAAQLGYGDGDEVTTVSFGGASSSKYITTYFRHQFNIVDPARYQSLSLELLRDDGVVIYLNGTEVLRDSMPTGAIDYLTTASSTISGSAEDEFTTHFLPANALVAGANTLAVEIHQRSASSSDISMDLGLTGSVNPIATNIVRGPYLQMGSSDGMTIRWRTNLLSNSQVRYGTSIDNLNVVVDSATEITDHEIRLTGLNPQTIYYYSVGNSTDVLADGAGYQFETSPSIGTRESTRIWVIGDAGTANSSARAVYDAYQAETGAAYTDLWLMLGDNAYNSGTDTEYQAAVFDLYPELLRKTPVWSTLGNHDGYSADSDTETGPYYDIFTLPRQAEAGGVASGTEAYYSFDHGNIHFVVLDSYETIQSTTANATMLQWLETDLLNSDAEWTIAFWHHPPYSKGSHDSDTDTRMTKMREQVLPIIENHGVDLVLGGHSHAYERSKFIDGHYGIANTLTLANQIDAGSGRTDGTGAYHKDEIGSSRTGAVYVVAGSSGKLGGGTFDHNAMFLSLRQLGSMILEVDGLTLNASFLDSTGVKQDYFTITKTNATVDSDSDGITDDVDNCLAIANADQANNDADADGDVCDADDDNDGVDDGLDAFPFNANETSDNDGDGTGDNGDLDDDNDGMPDTWEIDNGFNPLDSSDALQDTDRDGVSNLDEYLAGSNPNDPYFTWDIDGDGEVKPLTDGLLNLRYHFGFRGDTLTNSAVGSGAIRSTASDIESYIADAIIDGDIDGDDTTKPLTDGLLLLRYLFGFRGDTLIQNAIAGDAIRQSASEIEAYTASKMP